MKKTLVAFSLLMSIFFTAVIFTNSGCASESLSQTETGISNSYAILPLDIDKQEQAVANLFSWQSFIAMNWPANTLTCGPDTSKGNSILSGKGPVVWETYLSDDQVFVKAPAQPQLWCTEGNKVSSFSHLPKQVLALANKTGVYRFIHSTSKSSAHGMSGIDQAVGGPLVDQNGRFARYELRMNWDEYNYITTNTLWDTAGQNKFLKHNTVSLPAGPTSYGPVGAMELKAAWKVLGKGDDASKFYTIKAIVYNDDSGDPSPGENPVTLGLIGLHIARKTATQRNWVWSTFEQVDNLSTSFYNSACDTCRVNTPISGSNITELDANGKPLHAPTQVTRVNPIQDPSADSLNTHFQALLKGSVWANYKLVSTQWLLFENMFPLYLANSVQETYVQGPNPPSYGGFPLRIDEQYFADPRYKPFSAGVSSSCMGCHFAATIGNSKSDFSFMLGEAQ